MARPKGKAFVLGLCLGLLGLLVVNANDPEYTDCPFRERSTTALFLLTFSQCFRLLLSVCHLFSRRHDIHRNDTQHNGTQPKGLISDIQHNDT